MPSVFAEKDLDKSLQLIGEYSLGTLVVSTGNGFEVNHLPFVADIINTDQVHLRAHIPRANSLSSLLADQQKCVVTFNGANGYITPSWYATKKEHGKVVPTWNYSVVHVHGEIAVVDDRDWVRQQLQTLTTQHEAGRAAPWAITDAPDEYIDKKLGALVGLQVMASRIEAKTKASQNQPQVNRASVLRALRDEQPDSDLHKMVEAALTEHLGDA